MTTIRLGTRGSKLALWQAQAVGDALKAAQPDMPEPELVVIATTGDRVRDRRLAEIGGKGLFTKEIDAALLDGRIDAAVHSMKDVETWLTGGVVLAAMLPREDPRDAFVCAIASTIAGLPRRARVGTASVRRTAQLLARRPDLDIVLLRGNVDTRLAKVRSGEVAATLLAYAGLKRLGLAGEATSILEADDLLPAAGQGAIGVTCRADDSETLARLAAIDHGPTWAEVQAERAVLARLDGSCRTPIAALARVEGEVLNLTAMVLAPDGSRQVTASRHGLAADAAGLGDAVGLDLLDRGARGLLESA